MQSPSAALNIGADIAKDAIVVACSEGSFPVREVANQRPAVLAFLKSLPAGYPTVTRPIFGTKWIRRLPHVIGLLGRARQGPLLAERERMLAAAARNVGHWTVSRANAAGTTEPAP